MQKELLHWFKKHQRLLPWRENYDPYEVWISEIMLQQTQVKTALPYFDRWMKAFPTIRSVAEADEDHILKLWEGLGYYSRARNLQKAAKILADKNNGKMYEKYEDILSLPGVGGYTAAAIASIAYNQNYPVVDGNVIRVLSRLKSFDKNTREPQNIKLFWKWAKELLPHGEARNFNQGMMELGALICKPGATAECHLCPLKQTCEAYQKGTVSSLPNRGEKPPIQNIKVSIAVIRKKDKIFIQKRPQKGLMGGLWEFPGGQLEKGETALQALHREIDEELGIRLKNIKLITQIKHAYTRFKVQLHCFEAEYDEGEIQLTSATKGKWVALSELRDYPFPVANVRLIEKLLN